MKYKFLNTNLAVGLILTGCTKNSQRIAHAKNLYQQSLVAAEKNQREALILVDKSLELDQTPQSMALKATLLYQIGSYQESLKLFEQIRQHPRASKTLLADISNNYACNLLAVGNLAKAREVWLELTQNRFYLSPEVAWFNLGLLAYSQVPQKKKYSPSEINLLQQAGRDFGQALKLNTDYIDCLFYLSLTLMRLQRYEEAQQSLVQIIGIMPEHTQAHELLKQLEKKSRTR
jgi:tetratricopeptide (TPR) repeat protein